MSKKRVDTKSKVEKKKKEEDDARDEAKIILTSIVLPKSVDSNKYLVGSVISSSCTSLKEWSNVIIMGGCHLIPLFSRNIVYNIKMELIIDEEEEAKKIKFYEKMEELNKGNNSKLVTNTSAVNYIEKISLSTKHVSKIEKKDLKTSKNLNTSNHIISNLNSKYESIFDTTLLFKNFLRIKLISLIDMEPLKTSTISYEGLTEICNEFKYDYDPNDNEEEEENNEIKTFYQNAKKNHQEEDIHKWIDLMFFNTNKTVKERSRQVFDPSIIKKIYNIDILSQYNNLIQWFSWHSIMKKVDTQPPQPNQNSSSSLRPNESQKQEETEGDFIDHLSIHFSYDVYEKCGKKMLSDTNAKTNIKNIYSTCIENPFCFVIFNANKKSMDFGNVDFRLENNYTNTDNFRIKDSRNNIPLFQSRKKFGQMIDYFEKNSKLSKIQSKLYKIAFIVGERIARKMATLKTDQLFTTISTLIYDDENPRRAGPLSRLERPKTLLEKCEELNLEFGNKKGFLYLRIHSLLTNGTFSINSIGNSRQMKQSISNQLIPELCIAPFYYHKDSNCYELREQYLAKCNIIQRIRTGIQNNKNPSIIINNNSTITTITTTTQSTPRNVKNYILAGQIKWNPPEEEEEEEEIIRKNLKKTNQEPGAVQEKPEINLTDEQKEILDGIENFFLTILDGDPGTGKSFLIPKIIEKYGKENVAVLTCTGKCAGNIKSRHNLVCQVSTIRNAYKSCKNNSKELNDLIKIVVIEEASMMDNKLFSMALSIYPNQKGIVMICGAGQLGPIDLGQPYASLKEYYEDKEWDNKKLLNEEEDQDQKRIVEKEDHVIANAQWMKIYNLTKNFRQEKIVSKKMSNTSTNSGSKLKLFQDYFFSDSSTLNDLKNIFDSIKQEEKQNDGTDNMDLSPPEEEKNSTKKNDESILPDDAMDTSNDEELPKKKTKKKQKKRKSTFDFEIFLNETKEEILSKLAEEFLNNFKNPPTILCFQKDSASEINKIINQVFIAKKFKNIKKKMKSISVLFVGQVISLNLSNHDYSIDSKEKQKPDEPAKIPEKVYTGDIFTIRKIHFFDKVKDKKNTDFPTLKIVNTKKGLCYMKDQEYDIPPNNVIVIMAEDHRTKSTRGFILNDTEIKSVSTVKKKMFDVKRTQISPAWCLPVNKTENCEYENVYLCITENQAMKYLNRQLLVAITRPTASLKIFCKDLEIIHNMTRNEKIVSSSLTALLLKSV